MNSFQPSPKSRFLGRMGLGAILLIGTTLHADPIPAPCTKVNPNTVLCIQPPGNAVSSCTGLTQQQCSGAAWYDINQFPNGSVPNPTGTTIQQQQDCWQRRDCDWNITFKPASCMYTQPTAWYQGAKTVTGPTPCP